MLDEKYARFIQVVETTKALTMLGCSIHIIASGITPYLSSRVKETTIKIHILPSIRRKKIWKFHITLNYLFYLTSFFTILSIAAKEKINCIYTRHLKLSCFLLKLKTVHRIPVVYEIHGIESITRKTRKKLSRQQIKEQQVLQRVHGIISITETLTHQLIKMYKSSCPVVVAPDGVNLDDFPYVPKLPLAPNICYVGHFYPWKGVDTAVEAMKLIDNVHLFLVGGRKGDKDFIRIKTHIKNLNIANKITTTGFLRREDMLKYMHKSRVAIIPLSTHPMAGLFTSPLKLFEYMATGIPIVASDVPSIREVLKPFDNAVLVPPNNPEALARGIKLLIEDKQLAERMRKKAREDVRAYTWNERAKKINHFITSHFG